MPINNISQVFTGTERNTSMSFAAKLQNGWQQKKYLKWSNFPEIKYVSYLIYNTW